MAKLPKAILNEKIKDLGLIDENDKPISFAKFKQRIDIHQYGKGQRRLFILFIGQPKENLLAFYPRTDTRPSMLKIAYEYLVDTITTSSKEEYEDDNVMWGNCGYPLSYGRVRAEF
jgi:hypothetical protein